MFNLLQLFIRLSGFFVFIVLEVVCFSLVVQYNQRQQEVYVNTVNRMTGYLQQKTAASYQYLGLYEENKRLAKENAFLLEQLANAGINAPSSPDTMRNDSLQPKYVYLDARVIKNSINANHNYLVLDKGSKHGVKAHSGVVTANGVVGVVRKVSNSYSVVMSMLHRQTRLSARLRNKVFFGSLVWRSTDIQTFNLEDIPKHANVMKGDTVETSGYSAIFPENIMLGTVEKIWLEPGSNFYTIELRSKLDLSKIQHAYIVQNILRDEQQQLEQAVTAEDE